MNKVELKLFRRFDILIFAAITVIAVSLFLFGFCEKNDKNVLVISADGKENTYSLDKDTDITVNSNGISLTVRIKDEKVFVLETDCKNKYCAHSAPISRSGQIIVCAPAHVSLKITGRTNGGDHDAVTG